MIPRGPRRDCPASQSLDGLLGKRCNICLSPAIRDPFPTPHHLQGITERSPMARVSQEIPNSIILHFWWFSSWSPVSGRGMLPARPLLSAAELHHESPGSQLVSGYVPPSPQGLGWAVPPIQGFCPQKPATSPKRPCPSELSPMGSPSLLPELAEIALLGLGSVPCCSPPLGS